MNPTSAEFSQQESDLLFRAWTLAASAKVGARRHLGEGFARRLLFIQTNRLTIFQIAHEGRTEALDGADSVDINLHLNSYYFHLRGALDNLAWALHYQLDLLGSGDEDEPDIRKSCYLFHDRFLAELEKPLPALTKVLRNLKGWAKELKESRDPVAHRIPLCALPGVATEAEAARARALYAQATKAAKKGDIEKMSARNYEARHVATYQPLLVKSNPSGLEMRELREMIPRDHVAFLFTSGKVLDAFPVPEATKEKPKRKVARRRSRKSKKPPNSRKTRARRKTSASASRKKA